MRATCCDRRAATFKLGWGLIGVRTNPQSSALRGVGRRSASGYPAYVMALALNATDPHSEPEHVI